MNTETPTLPGLNIVKPFRFESQPHEYKVTPLRECPTPAEMQECDTPDKIADYWRRHITTHPYFDPDRECFVAIILNTRRRVKGHYMVSIGTMDTILVHPRRGFPLGDYDRRFRDCAGAQPPIRRPHALRGGHQSDPRPHPRRSAFENRSD